MRWTVFRGRNNLFHFYGIRWSVGQRSPFFDGAIFVCRHFRLSNFLFVLDPTSTDCLTYRKIYTKYFWSGFFSNDFLDISNCRSKLSDGETCDPGCTFLWDSRDLVVRFLLSTGFLYRNYFYFIDLLDCGVLRRVSCYSDRTSLFSCSTFYPLF